MCTVHCSGCFSCYAGSPSPPCTPPTTHAPLPCMHPCHTCPLPCTPPMPPLPCTPLPCMPPATHTPLSCMWHAPSAMQAPPPPLNRILDTRLWKHYISATSFAGGNKQIWPHTHRMSSYRQRRPQYLRLHCVQWSYGQVMVQIAYAHTVISLQMDNCWIFFTIKKLQRTSFVFTHLLLN